MSQGLTRREFVKGTLAGAGVLAGFGAESFFPAHAAEAVRRGGVWRYARNRTTPGMDAHRSSEFFTCMSAMYDCLIDAVIDPKTYELKLVPGLATDVNYNYLTYVRPLEGWGAFGLGIVFLSYGQSEGRDENGNFTGNFGSNEFSPALYYGTRVLPDLAVGASLKWIRIQLAPNSSNGVRTTFGLDLAALYKIPAARLNFGLNVQNLGPSVTFINEDQASPLSRNVKVGAAWTAYEDKTFAFRAIGDFNQSLVTNTFRTYNEGAELAYANQFAARIGWYADPDGQISGLCYGFGASWSSLGLDFGAIPQAKDSGLDDVYKITLGYRF